MARGKESSISNLCYASMELLCTSLEATNPLVTGKAEGG